MIESCKTSFKVGFSGQNSQCNDHNALSISYIAIEFHQLYCNRVPSAILQSSGLHFSLGRAYKCRSHKRATSLQELAYYWQHEFDWQKAEEKINSYRHYKQLLNGIDVHFVHERSLDPNAIPLIFVHGWPGSFVEAFKIIGLLTKPGATLLLAPQQTQPLMPSLHSPASQLTAQNGIRCCLGILMILSWTVILTCHLNHWKQSPAEC